MLLRDANIHTANTAWIVPLRELSIGALRLEGTVRKSGSGTFIMGLNMTNTGILRIEEGRVHLRRTFEAGLGLIVRGELIQQAGAELQMAGGTLEYDSSSVRIAAGTVSGTGNIVLPTGFGDAGLRMVESFRPGNPTGVFNVGPGRLYFASTTETTFEIGLAGTAEVRASTHLAGTLSLRLATGFTPAVGTEWRLFNGRITGTFVEVLNEGVPAGMRLEAVYAADGVIARAVSL